MTSSVPTIVVALIRRGQDVLLVEAQGPDDPEAAWMLPGGKVEAGETSLAALRREVIEETGLNLVGGSELAFEVEVDLDADMGKGVYRALTFACEAEGELEPNHPDGLVRRAAWVEVGEALDRLSVLEWYECEPLRRFLSGEVGAGMAYRHRVSGVRGSIVRHGLETVDRER